MAAQLSICILEKKRGFLFFLTVAKTFLQNEFATNLCEMKKAEDGKKQFLNISTICFISN